MITRAERQVLADAANRIMNEPAFVQAMGQLRTNAMEALAKVSPIDSDAIMQHQATVRAIDGLVRELQNIVTAASGQRK